MIRVCIGLAGLVLAGCAHPGEHGVSFVSGIPHQGTAKLDCRVRWQGPHQLRLELSNLRASCHSAARDAAGQPGLELTVIALPGGEVHGQRSVFELVPDRASSLQTEAFTVPACAEHLQVHVEARCVGGELIVGGDECRLDRRPCEGELARTAPYAVEERA